MDIGTFTAYLILALQTECYSQSVLACKDFPHLSDLHGHLLESVQAVVPCAFVQTPFGWRIMTKDKSELVGRIDILQCDPENSEEVEILVLTTYPVQQVVGQ